MYGKILYTEKQEYGKIKIDKIYDILVEATKNKNSVDLNNEFLEELSKVLESYKDDNRNVIFEIKEPDTNEIEKQLLSIDITSFTKKGKELKKYLKKIEDLILNKFNIDEKVLKFSDLNLEEIKDSFNKNYIHFAGNKVDNKPSAYIKKYNISLNIKKEKKLTEEDKETIRNLSNSIKNSYLLSSGKYIEYLNNLNSFLLQEHKNNNYNFFYNIKLLEKEIKKYIKLDTELDRKNIKILASIFRNVPFRIKYTKIDDVLDSLNNKEIKLVFNFDILLNNLVNNPYSNLIEGIDKDLLELTNLKENKTFKEKVNELTTNKYIIVKTYIHMSTICIITNILLGKMENLYIKGIKERFNPNFFEKKFKNNLNELEEKVKNSNINFHNVLSKILALGLIYSPVLGKNFSDLLVIKTEYLKLIENLKTDGNLISIIDHLKVNDPNNIEKFIEIVNSLNNFILNLVGGLLNNSKISLIDFVNFIDNLNEDKLRKLKNDLYNKTFQNFETRFFTIEENIDIINKYIKMETEKEINTYYEKPDNLFEIKGEKELEKTNIDLKDKKEIKEIYKTNIKEIAEKSILFILNIGYLEKDIKLKNSNEEIIKNLRKKNKFLLDIDTAINNKYKLELVFIISLIIFFILNKKIKDGHDIKLLFLFNQNELEDNNEILNYIKILLADMEYLYEGKIVTKGLVKDFDISFKYRMEQVIYSLLNNSIVKKGTLNIENYPLLKKYFDNNKNIKELKILNLFNGFYKKRTNSTKYTKPTNETYIKYDNEPNYILLTKAVLLKITKFEDKFEFIRYPIYSFFEEIKDEKEVEEILKEENSKIFQDIKDKLEEIKKETINVLNVKFKTNKYLRRNKFLNIKNSIKLKDEDNETFYSYLDIVTVEVSQGLRKILKNKSIFIQTEDINYILPTNNLLKMNKELKSINNNTIINKYLYEEVDGEKIYIEDIDRILLLTDGTKKLKTYNITFSLSFINDMFKTSLERIADFYYEYRENKFVKINLIGLSLFNIIENTLK